MPVRATLTLGRGENGDRVHLDGSVDLARGGRFDGRIHAILPQLADLNAIFPHAELPNATDIDLDADLTADRSGGWQVGRFTGAGRRLDLGAYRAGLVLDRFAAAASASGAPLSIEALGSVKQLPFEIRGVLGSVDFWRARSDKAPIDLASSSASDTVSVRGSLSRHDDGPYGVIADLSLHLPDPAALNAEFGMSLRPAAIEGPITVSGRSVTDFSASLDASKLQVGAADMPRSQVTATVADPEMLVVQASFPGAPPWITWREDLRRVPRHVVLRLDGSGLPTAPLSTLAVGHPVIDGQLTIKAMLEADADGSHLDPATLNGPVDITVSDASLEPSVLQSLIGTVTRAARLPKIGASSAHVRCASGIGEFTSGMLNVKHFALVSPVLTMTGTGIVDFPKGLLNFHVEPTVRVGPTNLATAVLLSGTTTSPEASLEPGADGRVGFQIGHFQSADLGQCAGTTARPQKPPKPADLLRALGILR